MSLGGWGIAIALAASVAAIGAILHPATRHGRWPRRLCLVAAVSMVAALAWLMGRFIVADTSIEYVHLYTHRDLPLRWRIAGTWTGREGSLLLWSAWATLIAAAYAVRSRRPAVLGAILALTVPLQAALLWHGGGLSDPFGPTPEWLLQRRPDGTGLNPTLRSVFILIHPPLMFLAYALTTVPAAGALTALWQRRDDWSAGILPWSRACWWTYTAAIGLGSMWAYVTLNFGGYWAWDPVEVANLLPWVALTAFLHIQVRHAHHGAFSDTAPVIAVLPLLLTLFSTFSTRSGLWVSVHAFTDPTNTFRDDPAGRLLDILAADASLLPYAALLLALPAITLALWTRRLSHRHGTFTRTSRVAAALFGAWAGLALAAPAQTIALLLETGARIVPGRAGYGTLALAFLAVAWAALPLLAAPEAPPAKWRRLGYQPMASTAAVLLLGGLMVLFLFHMAAIRGWSQAFYEARFPWIVLPGILAISLFQLRGAFGVRKAWWGTAAIAAMAMLAALAADAYGAPAGGIALLFASTAAVAGAMIHLYRSGIEGSGKARAGRGLVLLAAALDVLFWIDPPSVLGLPVVLRLVMLVASVIALGYAAYSAAGSSKASPVTAGVLAAVLGGYVVALPLGLLGAWWSRGAAPGPAVPRLRSLALHGMHFAVLVILVGYGASTYLRETVEADTADGPFDVAGFTFRATEPQIVADGVVASAIDIRLRVQGATLADTTPPARLTWEQGVAAHLPSPAILRLWDRDVYVAVDAIEVASEDCFAEGTVAAYAPSERICVTDTIQSARVRVMVLPGMDLLWGGLVLLLSAMALHLVHARPPRPHMARKPFDTPEGVVDVSRE